MNTENVTLYFREGSSDRACQACLEESGSGWVVSFAYGRRGAAMSTGTKTNEPIAYAKAKVVYDKLVKEKMAKGYTPGETGILPVNQPGRKKHGDYPWYRGSRSRQGIFSLACQAI
jgi:bifunctional non-homologous end joining protein LigD